MKNNWKDEFDKQFPDIWKLLRTAEENQSACPVFERINRDITGYIESLLAEQKKELMDKYKDRIQKYKSYYNPVGDELNKGKHIACDDLLESLKHHE